MSHLAALHQLLVSSGVLVGGSGVLCGSDGLRGCSRGLLGSILTDRKMHRIIHRSHVCKQHKMEKKEKGFITNVQMISGFTDLQSVYQFLLDGVLSGSVGGHA